MRGHTAAAALVAIALVAGCPRGGDGGNARQGLVERSTLEEVQKRGVLRVGFEAGYRPFEMTDRKGNFIGFDVDMAREMAKAMGVKVQFVNTSWDGIIPALLTRKFDIIMSGMTVTPERTPKVNFAEPYLVVGQTALVAKRHAGTVESYRDLDDPSFTVTSKLGTTGEMAAKRLLPRCNYKSFEGEAEAALEVLNGKADAFVYDLPYCSYFYQRQGRDRLLFLDEPFTYEPLAWAIRKGDPDFLNWLDNFLRQVKNDGRYDRMVEKWIESAEWHAEVEER